SSGSCWQGSWSQTSRLASAGGSPATPPPQRAVPRPIAATSSLWGPPHSSSPPTASPLLPPVAASSCAGTSREQRNMPRPSDLTKGDFMIELQLTRTEEDHRRYLLEGVGTLRLEGLSSRNATGETANEDSHFARRGVSQPVLQ